MKLPRDLSGAELIKALCRDWTYRQVNQEGSHVILETDTPSHQRLSVPNHNLCAWVRSVPFLRAVAGHKGVDRQAVLDSLR